MFHKKNSMLSFSTYKTKKRFSLIDWEISPKAQTALSLLSSFVSYVVTLGISFFLSPYIVKMLGEEANGFTSLASNFTSYAQIITLALNGMGGRYIVVSYHRGDYEKASRYFTTLFLSNIILSLVFLIAGGACVYKLEYIVNISENLVTDVKCLFSLVFINFIFNTLLSQFSCSVTIKNKLYLTYFREIQGQLIRGILLLTLFMFLVPKVYFIGIGALASSVIAAVYNIIYKIHLVPEIKIRKEYFTPKYLKELLSNGIWNSLSQAGAMLLTGLDLLITNLFVSSSMMGVLSVAKTVPSIFSTIATTISSIFYPQILLNYSKNNSDGIVSTIRKSTKVIVFIVSIGTSFLIVFGYDFYSLWQPTLDARVLQILSILSCLGTIVICAGQSMTQVFTVTLHIRENSISVIVTGVLSTILTFVLVKYTSLGVYAVAGVSTVLGIIRSVVFLLPKAAEFLNKKKNVFFYTMRNAILCNSVLCLIGFLIKQVLNQDSWFKLIFTAVVFALIGLISNFFVVLNRSERKMLVGTIKAKIKK